MSRVVESKTVPYNSKEKFWVKMGSEVIELKITAQGRVINTEIRSVLYYFCHSPLHCEYEVHS